MMSGLGQHPPGGEPQHGGEQSPSHPSRLRQAICRLPVIWAPGEAELTPSRPAGRARWQRRPKSPPRRRRPRRYRRRRSGRRQKRPRRGWGAMGPMMMPPMRGVGGEGSEADNKQLYQERKLKVVAPANSEPVKNRREGRAKPDDRKTP